MSIIAVNQLPVSDRCQSRLQNIILGMASRKESINVLPSYAKCLHAAEFFALSGEEFLNFLQAFAASNCRLQRDNFLGSMSQGQRFPSPIHVILSMEIFTSLQLNDALNEKVMVIAAQMKTSEHVS